MLELGHLLVEANELLADQPLALERLAGEILPAEFKRGAGAGLKLQELALPAIA